MERSEAERVFSLVREISGDLRGRILTERWWLVWIATGADMLLACVVVQLLIWNGEARPPILVIVLLINVLIIFLIIRFIHRRAGGQRTFIETALWWIWATKILGTFGVVLVEVLVGLPLFKAAPVFALFAAGGFSSMALITHRWFLWFAVLFVGVAIAMSLFPRIQFFLYGIAWFSALLPLGLYYRITLNPPRAQQL